MIGNLICAGIGIAVGCTWPVFFRNEAIALSTWVKNLGKPKAPKTPKA